MKPAATAALVELTDYFAGYDLTSLVPSAPLKAHLTAGFKRYYPLLILEAEVSRKSPWRNSKNTANFRAYMKETVSDLCQAIMLAYQGFYKPAYLSLRSAVENFVRCLGISQDLKVLDLQSVYELIDTVKAAPFISQPVLKEYYSVLRSQYKSLCGHVHTSSSAHMALTTLVGEFPRYVDKTCSEFFSSFAKVVAAQCAMLCLVAPKSYHSLHHKHLDIVADSLPAKVKGLLAS